MPTTTPSPSTVPPTADPNLLNLLALLGQSVVQFTGATSVVLPSNGPAVSSQFSIQLSFTQSQGTSGYLLSKCDAAGNRYYAIYSTPSWVYFFYGVQGRRLSTVSFVRFGVSLNDGQPHTILFSINTTSISLFVDWSTTFSGLLAGPVQDCGAASPACILALGARAGSSPAYFTGNITSALLYAAQALQWAPTTLAPPTTTMAMPSTPGIILCAHWIAVIMCASSRYCLISTLFSAIVSFVGDSCLVVVSHTPCRAVGQFACPAGVHRTADQLCSQRAAAILSLWVLHPSGQPGRSSHQRWRGDPDT